jgi:hypothetical protein
LKSLSELEAQVGYLQKRVAWLQGYERSVDAYMEEANKLAERNAELEKLLVGDVRRYLKTLNKSKANRLVEEIESIASEEAKRWIGLGF